MLEYIVGFYCGALAVIIAWCVVGMIREARKTPEPVLGPSAEIVEADTSGALIHLLACEGAALLRERAK